MNSNISSSLQGNGLTLVHIKKYTGLYPLFIIKTKLCGSFVVIRFDL